MGKPKVYVTRRVPESGINLLKEHCEITQWNEDDAISRDELLKNVPGIDALFCMLTDKIDDVVMDAAGPQLKSICTMSVGFDHIDVEECKKRGIKVGNTPEVSSDAVAEMALALLLSVSRRVVEGINAVKSGEWGTWKPMWLCGPGLLHSTVGIVGLGEIGMCVARRLKVFNPSRILYTDVGPKDYATEVKGEFVKLDGLLEECDFIVICCALTRHTQHMFNKDSFSKMKKGAILVNISRGGVIKHMDLYEALKDGQIRAAAIDVTEVEPLPTDDPLLTLPNCVVLPHLGSATEGTRILMSELTAKNIMAVLNGGKMPAPIPDMP